MAGADDRHADCYQEIFESATDMIFVQDAHTGEFIDVNRKARLATGYSLEEFQRHGPELFSPDDPRYAPERAMAHIARAAAGEPQLFEWAYLDREGRLHPTEVHLERIQFQGRACLVGVCRDISQRRQAEAERRAFERKMLQTQKLESLGLLAGGIAHDFNNILMGVLGHTGLALRHLKGEPEARQHMEKVELAARRAAQLVSQMLLFSGAGAPEQELVHLGMVVDEISVLLDTVVSPRARLVFQLEPDLPPVLGNPAAVRQIVMNLITNASEALEGRPGEIRIRTSSVSLEAEELAAVTLGWERTAGRYCVLEVSDDGCGMSAADKERIFDPFFSSKSFGRGLGLAAVLGAVRTMGGSVEVRSAPGEGSVFRILLPCAEGLAEEPEEGDNDADATLRGRVLVVDDELMVRETTSEFLELLGLEAVTVSSGEEGLRVLSEGGASIDAALLDMTMPGLNGIETLRRMRGLGWTGPVVLCSGYVLGDTDVEPRPDAFLRKPYSIRKLQRTLEKLLLRT